MKHNEVKAYVKKKIKEVADEHKCDTLSADTSNSTRVLFIVDRSTLVTLLRVRTFFNDTEFSISLSSLENKCIETFTGNYMQLHIVRKALSEIGSLLGTGNVLGLVTKTLFESKGDKNE